MPTPPTILMTDPSHYEVSYQINPWMRPAEWSADPAAQQLNARALWLELKVNLERAGARIHVAQAGAGLPDMVFPANAAVVLNGKALMAKFRHPERAAEEAPFAKAFEALLKAGVISQVTPNPGIDQEGAGDCIWDATRRLFWVGNGPRSSPHSGAMIAEHFGEEVVSLPLATERYYHLDTCFCPLSGGEILYYPRALTTEALGRLRGRVEPALLIEASEEDAQRFCVNAVSIGRTLVMAAPSGELEHRLGERGYRVATVDVSPFILAGGGAFCMTLRLDLSSAKPATVRRTQSHTLQLDEVTS